MSDDITGQKFGLVTVVGRDPWSVRNNPAWLAVCECGRGRWFHARLLQNKPPKTHRFCYRGTKPDTPELPLDSVRA